MQHKKSGTSNSTILKVFNKTSNSAASNSARLNNATSNTAKLKATSLNSGALLIKKALLFIMTTKYCAVSELHYTLHNKL